MSIIEEQQQHSRRKNNVVFRFQGMKSELERHSIAFKALSVFASDSKNIVCGTEDLNRPLRESFLFLYLSLQAVSMVKHVHSCV